MVKKLIKALKEFVAWDGLGKAFEKQEKYSNNLLKKYEDGEVQHKERKPYSQSPDSDADIHFSSASTTLNKEWKLRVFPEFKERIGKLPGAKPVRVDRTNFHVALGEEGGITLSVKWDSTYGAFLALDYPATPTWYKVKFDHEPVRGKSLYDLVRKLHKVAKEMGIGVEFKDVKITEGEIGSSDYIHIYPRFEGGLTDKQAAKKFAEFYEAAKKHGVDIRLNYTDRDVDMHQRAKNEIKKRGKAKPEYLNRFKKKTRKK